ncbi:hypothetical protein D3C74_459180 [compost metagenome]
MILHYFFRAFFIPVNDPLQNQAMLFIGLRVPFSVQGDIAAIAERVIPELAQNSFKSMQAAYFR